MTDRLTLREAREQGRLADFVAQAELRDYESDAADRFDRVVEAGATAAPAA